MVENIRIEAAGCNEQVKISDEVRQRFLAIQKNMDWADPPSGDWEPCALVAGHVGRHFALGLGTSEDTEWFLVWSDGSEPELVELAMCDSGFPTDEGEAEVCLLPMGHIGPHVGMNWWVRPAEM
jgi:hypothetical protein